MKLNKPAKQATVVLLSTAILFGGSGSLTFAKQKEMLDHKESYGISHITRFDMENITEQQNDSKFKVPTFDESTIKNIPSAKGYDENGNLIDLDVWDTWPLQNADGTVAEYNGYQIVFGLAGDPDKGWDTFIYMFYKKIGDNSINAWKNAGRVFKDSDKYATNDVILNNQAEEWSGSATFTSDGKIRLFYTNRHGWDPEHGFFGKQTLTTAQVNVSKLDANTLKIDGVEDHKSIYDGGDGSVYQTVDQAFSGGNYADNHTLRDPHYVEDNGHKYLVFEANTGTDYGYQGEESLFNKIYYGGNTKFFRTEKKQLLQSPKKNLATLANGALGIIEINDDYTLKKEMKPLIASNTVTDEIERANIFEKDGKWYLFTSSRGSKMTIDGINDKDIYLLGYVANSITGPYKPLNKTGIVLHQNLDPNDVTWNYAHFAIPQKNSDNVVVTSYMTNRGLFEDHKSTFAPSFLLNIKGNKTSVVKNSILEQGQITINN
ncbi:glycoside hydrolase family 68 protein [Niallia sp. Sow4_A1]|jgi:levansucrase|uniref:Glycoside hydrolase family 68 protein n=1 Tax=Niallia hominis TaxID=3133173 RepID=A0ABV1EZT0_9BACI|nr:MULTISPECIES: glycoside hydrolase family 68 protein [Bacillaceae]MCM3362482.1 glycoside hydrolase family 68 protein [Niallia sp. MER TA 168]REB75778.1 glycoside hydrolase 68 family protein [Cutibacterium acnes]